MSKSKFQPSPQILSRNKAATPRTTCHTRSQCSGILNCPTVHGQCISHSRGCPAHGFSKWYHHLESVPLLSFVENKSSTKAELIYIRGIFYSENEFKIRYRRGKLRVIPFMIQLVTSVHRDFAFFSVCFFQNISFIFCFTLSALCTYFVSVETPLLVFRYL